MMNAVQFKWKCNERRGLNRVRGSEKSENYYSPPRLLGILKHHVFITIEIDFLDVEIYLAILKSKAVCFSIMLLSMWAKKNQENRISLSILHIQSWKTYVTVTLKPQVCPECHKWRHFITKVFCGCTCHIWLYARSVLQSFINKLLALKLLSSNCIKTNLRFQILEGHTDEIFSSAFNYEGDIILTGIVIVCCNFAWFL